MKEDTYNKRRAYHDFVVRPACGNCKYFVDPELEWSDAGQGIMKTFPKCEIHGNLLHEMLSYSGVEDYSPYQLGRRVEKYFCDLYESRLTIHLTSYQNFWSKVLRKFGIIKRT